MSIALHGIAASSGIAIGLAHLVNHAAVDIVHYVLPEKEITAELQRFDEAIRLTRKELEMLWGSIPDNAPTELGAFLSLHIMLLNDASLSREPRHIIEHERCNAEWALKIQRDRLLEQFDEIEESYLRERRNDVIQVVDRIFKSLAGKPHSVHETQADMKNRILVAHDLSPADMVQFKGVEFAAFITDVGGSTSHTAILARSMDLPAVLALHNAHQLIEEDECLIVDGMQGVVIVNPDPHVLAEYRRRQAAWLVSQDKLNSLRTTEAITCDGTPVELHANIELPEDAIHAKENGAVGVGLFRSEFLFLSRQDSLPSEDEQFQAYRTAVETMAGAPVVIRTLDLGADKNPKWAVHGLPLNPAMGLTGIRLCLAEPHLFRTQLRALLRASAHGKLKILIPMINSLAQLRQALAHIEEAKQSLDQEGLPYDKNIEIGSMIEVPAAALIVGSLVKHLDFLSIGTNDLIQYTLAIDRGDDAVSHLYDPLHPAVLHLIGHTIKTANKANVPVSVCGEMAGDAKLTRVLLGLGLRRFSMHPSQLLKVKQEVLTSNLSVVTPFVTKMQKTEDADKMRDLLAQLNAMQSLPAEQMINPVTADGA